ncbi:MAG: GerMN domain-containing protein [Candidatus Obscuribacterales bacterium]|nr:GerMN domain-containing protein [Candidatus Obscuribacterales bacterium]
MNFRAGAIFVVAAATLMLNSCAVERTVLSESDKGTKRETVKQQSTKIWFVKTNDQGAELVAAERVLVGEDKLESAVNELLRGPSANEIALGYGSEIPRGTILLSVKEAGDKVELDLSRRFVAGEGATSFETRLNQLAKTAASVANGKEIYLNVEGERLTMTQGEGIEVKQPINN